jgi:hypothetical protein
MDANPYARYLDGRPILEILSATPAILVGLAESLGPDRLAAAPAPGKWSPAKILAHLADTDLAFGYRLRQILAQNPAKYPGEPAHSIQPFDQDRWAASYEGIPAQQALAAFTALREWNLLLIRNAPSSAGAIPATHPERGSLTFQTIIETLAGHDLNHLQQLQKLAEQ